MNGQDRDAIAKLELSVKELHKTVETIKTNDLPHINEKIDGVETKVDVVEVATADALGKLSVLIPLVAGTLIVLVFSVVAVIFLT